MTLLVGALAVVTTGCAYRLPAPSLPTQEHIRVIAKMPELYVLSVNTGTVTSYDVPPKGRVIINVPSYRPTCGVYLFTVIKVAGHDPLKYWDLSVVLKGKTIRKMSLRKVRELAIDQEGYHILRAEE